MAGRETVSVSEERWRDAQRREGEYWASLNGVNSRLAVLKKFYGALRRGRFRTLAAYLRFRDFYCGDDSNYWWMKQFGGYAVLPRSVDRALEVGCGPFTNLRLITGRCSAREVYCCDPLIEIYRSFRSTWLSSRAGRRRIRTFDYRCEDLRFADGHFDLVVCINVLDHVQDARLCLREIDRVTRKGGFVVVGQDLSNEEDIAYWEDSPETEIRDTALAHPIKISHLVLDAAFSGGYDSRLKKLLPREQGRKPAGHYGTYIYVGRKR